MYGDKQGEIRTIHAKNVLAVYEDGYTEIHEVDKKGKVQSGKPLLADMARNMFSNLYDDVKKKPLKFKGILPRNIISIDVNNYKLLWSVKPMVRDLIFDKKTKIKSGKYPTPKLVFEVNGRDLSVYAYKGNLTEKTYIYQAPYWNTSSSGSVCQGSARIKRKEFVEDIIKEAEMNFFGSMFTHSNAGKLSEKSYIQLMKEIINTDTFPTDTLIKTETQLKDLL